eukprot:SAG11_NODE_126_length_15729_cov_9.966859_2_plen_128_part_00
MSPEDTCKCPVKTPRKMADNLAQLENELEGKQNDLALIKQHFSEVNGEAAGHKSALKALEKERSDHGKREAEVRAKTETLISRPVVYGEVIKLAHFLFISFILFPHRNSTVDVDGPFRTQIPSPVDA